MTTFYPFTPSNSRPFQFSPTLDGNTYTVIVTASLFGQRYYVNIYDLSGNRVVTLPLIGSRDGIAIASILWISGVAVVRTQTPHGFQKGTSPSLVITGMLPDKYNGTFECLIVDDFTFQYPINLDPGPTTSVGTVFYNISMTAGYFQSLLVYRPSTNRFEVSP